MPDELQQRKAPPRATLSRFTRRLLQASVAAFCVVLLAVLADILFDLTLPQPVRGWLPLALAATLCLSLVIGVSAYGAARRPEPAGGVPAAAAQTKDRPGPA
jgi:hypothetical protein